MKKLVFITALVLSSLLSIKLSAQQKHAFWQEIQTIKSFDQLYAPPVNPILFIGSSSIRKWDDLPGVFPGRAVLNRGFGGAATNDVLFYSEDLIFPYKPRQIVLYVGENDLVEPNVNADSVFARFKNLYSVIRTKLPAVSLVYISIKPSPVRAQYLPVARQANLLISQFLKADPHAVFVDVFSPMLNREGRPRPELFGADMLHMNSAGYVIWQKAVEPYLVQ